MLLLLELFRISHAYLIMEQ